VRSKPYTISVQNFEGRPGIPKSRSKYNIKANFYRNKTLRCGVDLTGPVKLAMPDFCKLSYGSHGLKKEAESTDQLSNYKLL
jgi:hypothetical protein